jgi:hypothetical protein
VQPALGQVPQHVGRALFRGQGQVSCVTASATRLSRAFTRAIQVVKARDKAIGHEGARERGLNEPPEADVTPGHNPLSRQFMITKGLAPASGIRSFVIMGKP